MTPMTETRMAKEINRRNLLWKKSGPAKRRVLIAKDVLAQIKAGTMEAAQMIYVRARAVYGAATTDSLRERFLALPDCQVCAIGAITVSCTLYANKATGKDKSQFENSGNHRKFRNGLHEVFDRPMRIKMERYFEGWGEDGCPFYNKYASAQSRLRAIMRNIVKNKGEFIP